MLASQEPIQAPPLLLRIETPAQIVYDVCEGKRLAASLSGSALSSLRQYIVLSHVVGVRVDLTL